MNPYFRHLLLVLLVLGLPTASTARDSSQVNLRDTTHLAVQFKSGALTLHGKLVMSKSSLNLPAVVVLTGSGAETSYRTNYKEWCEKHLEEQLLPEGIAILYFDKRGVGLSEGKWYNTSFYEQAADAKAALDFLKQQTGIDSTRLGVIGHDQGAWVAQLVASQYPQALAFGISMGGAPFGVKKQLISDYRSELLCKQIDPTEAKKMAERKAHTTLQLTHVPTNDFQKHLKLIKDFEPGPAIKAIQNPFLFLFAENDELVDPEWSEKELYTLFPEGIPHHIEYQVVPEANHSFRRAPMCYDEAWEDMPYSEECQHALRNWLLFHLNQQGPQAAIKTGQ